jgi:hypothetical protein
VTDIFIGLQRNRAFQGAIAIYESLTCSVKALFDLTPDRTRLTSDSTRNRSILGKKRIFRTNLEACAAFRARIADYRLLLGQPNSALRAIRHACAASFAFFYSYAHVDPYIFLDENFDSALF